MEMLRVSESWVHILKWSIIYNSLKGLESSQTREKTDAKSWRLGKTAVNLCHLDVPVWWLTSSVNLTNLEWTTIQKQRAHPWGIAFASVNPFLVQTFEVLRHTPLIQILRQEDTLIWVIPSVASLYSSHLASTSIPLPTLEHISSGFQNRLKTRCDIQSCEWTTTVVPLIASHRWISWTVACKPFQ